MTREEAIEIIECGDIYNRWGKDGEEVEKMVIKALEQEDILDKIRAEIEALEEGIFSYHNDRPWIFKDEVLGIIDKYKRK